MTQNLIVYVATNEAVYPKIKEIADQLDIEIYMTKLHIGDIMVVQKIPITEFHDEQSDVLKKATQATYENIPQIKNSAPQAFRNSGTAKEFDREFSDQILSGSPENGNYVAPEYYLKPLVLIERKTIHDFCTSLTNKHKKEQNIRMLQFRQNIPYQFPIRMYFVIEGYLQLRDLGEEFVEGKPIHVMESAFAKLSIRDQIHVQQVYSTSDHANWLKTVLKILQHEPDIIRPESERNLSQEYQQEAIKIAKSNNLDQKSIFINQLTCYQGVSPTKAKVVADHYSSFIELINAFKSTPNPEKMLAKLEIPLSKQSQSDSKTHQYLGPVLSKRIYENVMFTPKLQQPIITPKIVSKIAPKITPRIIPKVTIT